MERLKEAVALAAKIREDSWREGSKTYALDLMQAADQAAEQCGFDEQMTQPVYLLLACAWNDALDWAVGEGVELPETVAVKIPSSLLAQQEAQEYIDGFKGTPGEIYTPDLFGEELECNLVVGIAEFINDRNHLEMAAEAEAKRVDQLTVLHRPKISVLDKLPAPNQYVLAHLTKTNWGDDDDPKGNRYWVVVKFEVGITLEEREALPEGHYNKYSYGRADEGGNNLRGYCWDEFGPATYFGQEVDFWCKLPV